MSESVDNNWTIEDQGEITKIGCEYLIWGGDGDLVAGVIGSTGLGVMAEERARLISAAPDLLEVCEEMVAVLEEELHVSCAALIKKAQAAIAKAKGES